MISSNEQFSASGEAALQNHVVFWVPADQKALLRVAKVGFGNESGDAGEQAPSSDLS